MTAQTDPGSAVDDAEALAEDIAAVREARAGNERAFARLYDAYAPMVHAILLARSADADADDLVQDVFVSAWRRLAELRDEAAFGGWLASIARNRATDAQRRRRPTERLHDRHARSVESGTAEAMAIVAVVRTLPDAYREPLLMRLVEGMTGPEIAMRTGMTAGSVRVNLHRGMSLLRTRLAAAEGSDRHA